jgi:nucleotide-binding universal stress UspA family protein
MKAFQRQKRRRIIMYRNILVAYDGSEPSKRALDAAMKLTATFGGKLRVIHVFSLSGIPFGEAFMPLPQNFTKELYRLAESVVEDARKRTETLPYAEVQLVQGIPAMAILEFAEQAGSDLIVIGSRGLGGIREMVLGSVSHNVVQNARIPVLVVK